ncbi:hypothetical protein [Denitrobaculum tricleocarpae]|uniref:DUF4145 domain-containing protein n=1 Tax=Denitrobaculum tricleocarpae TaxID=2591009 RepID=A0A545U2P8_9PROT|nr:hypothetical protein [Denitrobaculum tricleocarpae]TQV83747.1 hypothetical protein FKG95_03970 [Denitrobaculum tricleocarpae]
MEQLELPSDEVWSERRFWFEDLEATAGQSGAPAPSEQACALMIDLQSSFCAGAFSAVVILAAAIIEAQAERAQIDDRQQDPGYRKARRWLQDLRNKLVHEDRESPAITVEDHWLRRGEWETAARRAIVLAFAALYPDADLSGAHLPGAAPHSQEDPA